MAVFRGGKLVLRLDGVFLEGRLLNFGDIKITAFRSTLRSSSIVPL